ATRRSNPRWHTWYQRPRPSGTGCASGFAAATSVSAWNTSSGTSRDFVRFVVHGWHHPDGAAVRRSGHPPPADAWAPLLSIPLAGSGGHTVSTAGSRRFAWGHDWLAPG